MSTDGTIQIRGLRCRGRQGTTDEERRQEHAYLVDVSVIADLERAIATDELGSSLDISAIAQTVREVRVRVEKPEPAGLGADAESVELTLRR